MNKDTVLFYSILGFAILGITLAAINPFDLQIVYAEEFPTILGKGFNDVLLSVDENGKERHLLSIVPERISSDGKYWHDYFFSNNDGVLRFESASLSFEFYDDTSDFKMWSGGLIEQRSPDIPSFTTTLKTAINGTDEWITYPLIPSSYSFEEIDYGMRINFQQNHNDVILKTIFDTTNNKGIKWTYEISNLAKENSKFGITNVCNNCGELFIDGEGFLDGSWTKEDLIHTNGTYKQLVIKGFVFDTQDYVHDYLWNIKNINGNIIFDFTYSKGVLEIGDTLVIDPTITQSSGGSFSTMYGATTSRAGLYLNNAASTLNGLIIDDITWYMKIHTGSPTGTAYTKIYNDAGTLQHTFTSTLDMSTITSSSVGYTFTSSGYTIQDGDRIVFEWNGGDNSNKISFEYAASDVYDGTNTVWNTYNGAWNPNTGIDPKFVMTYSTNPAPDSITDLTLDSATTTTAQLSFTPPGLNGESLITYSLYLDTPQTNNVLTFNQNDTSSPFNISGLLSGTAYSANATAVTAGGMNFTFANVLNFTTSSAVVPDAPSLAASIINVTAAKFTSTAGASAGDYPVKDYGLRCSVNSAAWNTIISNSTIPGDRIYNYYGLTENDLVSCQWRDGSLAGWSPWSSNATVSLVITGVIEGVTPLNDLNAYVQEYGGIYFGMGIFTFAFLLMGVMASPRTVPIFTVIIMSFAALLHVTEIFQMPYWYWGIAAIMTLTLVLKRKN